MAHSLISPFYFKFCECFIHHFVESCPQVVTFLKNSPEVKQLDHAGVEQRQTNSISKMKKKIT